MQVLNVQPTPRNVTKAVSMVIGVMRAKNYVQIAKETLACHPTATVIMVVFQDFMTQHAKGHVPQTVRIHYVIEMMGYALNVLSGLLVVIAQLSVMRIAWIIFVLLILVNVLMVAKMIG